MSKVGNYYGGLSEGFVDISPLSDKVPAAASTAIDTAREYMVNGKWDVFSGVALTFDANGACTSEDKALKTNDGQEIVAAGGASVDDGVITGSMNYFVEGVVQEQ